VQLRRVRGFKEANGPLTTTVATLLFGPDIAPPSPSSEKKGSVNQQALCRPPGRDHPARQRLRDKRRHNATVGIIDVYTRFIDAEYEELLPLSSQILLIGRAARVANDHGS